MVKESLGILEEMRRFRIGGQSGMHGSKNEMLGRRFWGKTKPNDDNPFISDDRVL